jgi:two-component system response regulator YesN
MIKILIVDDEIVIRKGIITSIDWESMGMTVAGEASNGREGFEKALALKPDIVITDVRMPVVDGLELTKLLKENMPNIRVVIISGYDEFKYAREALRMGVNEYLLKPIGADELIKIMLKQCDEIIRKNDEISQDTRIKSIFRENLSFMQTRFISSVLRGESDALPDISDKARELNVDLSGREYQVIIIDIDDFFLITENKTSSEKDFIKSNVKNAAEEILNPSTKSIVCLSEADYMFSVINVKDSNRYDLFNLYKEIRYTVKKFYGITLTIGVSNIYKSIADLPKAYDEALFTLKNKAFAGKDKIITICEVEKAGSFSQVIYPSSDEKEVIGYLKTMDTDKLSMVLERMYSGFIKTKPDYNEVKNVCLRMLTIAESQLDELGVDYRKYTERQVGVYAEIEKYETLEDIKLWMKNVFQGYIEAMQKGKNEKFKGIVKVAIQYVNDHYSENIGVEDIAAITYVSPNYFSRVFKKETGKSFTEWLNTLRLDKAKVLLKDLKFRVYEVAEKVGYNDYKIFTHNFKRYVGCTPKEYRENVLQTSQNHTNAVK